MNLDLDIEQQKIIDMHDEMSDMNLFKYEFIQKDKYKK
jgi:hypothetical protein